MGKKIPPPNPVSWQLFGKFIFEQREADPGYYVVSYLRNMNYLEAQLFRFCVAWCAFYNLGIAAKASELQGKQFYAYLNKVYPTAKRASERRHFRGAAGLKALAQWQENWPKPEALAEFIIGSGDLYNPDMGTIRTRCESVAQMGDYFKWKWGDLGEVLNQKPVLFRGWENVSPKVPQQGAALIAAEAGKPELSTEQVYRSISSQMRRMGAVSYYAPWRKFDVQDAETICCVYKQYRSGSYHPGIRTAKAYARLTKDGDGCKTAKDAAAALLRYQPQRKFQQPDTLSAILEGTTIFNVEDLCQLDR
jgi:hypothetical protein